jgi:3-oxoacyl-[acyl-carrier protein] reductase
MSDETQRVALVTGASRGIGKSIAERFASEGRHVICVGLRKDSLVNVVEMIRSSGGSADYVACDLSLRDSVGPMIDDVVERYGRIDILVNNAGITKDGALRNMSDEDFDDVLNLNLRAVFIACRQVARPMMRARFGRIINIGSISGLMGNPGQANYSASKAAIIGMSKSMAKELGSKGVTVNVVAPGFIKTDMTRVLGEEFMEKVASRVPVRRLGEPEDIANAVSWLASDESGYVTGQVLVVDGGRQLVQAGR